MFLSETSRLEGNNYTEIYGMFSFMRPSGCNFLIAPLRNKEPC